jgi:polyisoprenoid-binding protein YceI
MRLWNKTLHTCAAVAILLVLPLVAEAAPFKGQFKFTSNAPKEDIFGTADGSAELTITPADLKATRGTVKVSVASMKTGNDTRDEHLRGAGWLDAAKFPEIAFEITGVEVGATSEKDGVKSAEAQVVGKFTMHGVTKELKAPATIKWKDDKKAKITTSFTIALSDFAVTGGEIGSKVGAQIKCEATLTGTLP